MLCRKPVVRWDTIYALALGYSNRQWVIWEGMRWQFWNRIGREKKNVWVLSVPHATTRQLGERFRLDADWIGSKRIKKVTSIRRQKGRALCAVLYQRHTHFCTTVEWPSAGPQKEIWRLTREKLVRNAKPTRFYTFTCLLQNNSSWGKEGGELGQRVKK